MMFRRAFQLLTLTVAADAFKVAEVTVPDIENDKHDNIGTTAITIGDNTYETSYNVLLRSGDTVGDVVFGAVLDQAGNQIYAYPMDGSYVEIPLDNEPDEDTPLISNVPDFTSLIATPQEDAPTDFAMFAHFETPLPAQIYRINVDFADDCMLMEDSIEATNWTEWGGLWEPCSGKVTPWNTHLGSEEHEPDAKILGLSYDDFIAAYKDGNPTALNVMHFMRYYGLYDSDLKDKDGMDKLNEVFNPYKFGHVTEISVNEDGSTKTHKWYTTGRVSIENPEIMGDNKTIYIADDANYGILTRFVMDTPGDMSAGTLYAAKFTQVEDEDVAVSRSKSNWTTAGGSFTIEWIELGHSTQDEIVSLAESTVFEDIFFFAEPNEDDECDAGFTYVLAGWGPPTEECLRLKPDMEQAAAFLETRRYAAMMGATAETQSTEGMAFVGPDMKFYMSMSAISNGMDKDVEPRGHIGVVANKCGCVYEFDVDEEYVLTSMRALVCGEPIDGDENNACSTESIASPDNLFYTGTFGTEDDHSLLIAEDTSHHQNDYMWHYDLTTGKMTRILSTVYGSQVTGPAYFTDNLGCYLLMAVVPHPYKKSDQAMVNATNPNNMGLAGNVGYIGPIGTREEL